MKVAGTWTYFYRAVDSAGDTIDFMLSPKRDLTAARLFLRLALSGTGGIRPRIINVDGHPAYASAIAELKQSGDLGRRCRCRPSPYLNNIIEQDHRFIKKRIVASLGFWSAEGAWRTIEGYEAMHLIRKGADPVVAQRRRSRAAAIHPYTFRHRCLISSVILLPQPPGLPLVFLDSYRAVDERGQTVESHLSRTRDITAAKAFFRKALKRHGQPRTITLDGFEPSRSALRRMGMRNEFNFRWANAVQIRSCQFLNNIVQQDHRRITARVQPVLGFKKFYNARRVPIWDRIHAEDPQGSVQSCGCLS